MVGEFTDTILGHARYQDARSGCGGDIDLIQPDSVAADYPAALELGDHFRIDDKIVGHESINIARQMDAFISPHAVGIDYLSANRTQNSALRVEMREGSARNKDPQ